MIPHLEPIAENAKKFLELKVIKAVCKGTRSEKVILKIIKALGDVAPMLGFVDIAISVVSPEIDKKHEEILSRFDNIERILNVGFDTVERKIVFDKFLPLLSSMKSESEHFELIIQSYSNNETELASKLEEFIKHYQNEKLESNFVNQLTQTFAGIKSALHFLYERTLIDQKNIFNPKKTSPNQIMTDLYYSTVHMIFKGYSMLSYCYCLRNELKNQSSNTDQEFIKAKMDQDIENLKKAFKDLQSVANDDGLDSNIDLSSRTLQFNYIDEYIGYYLYLGDVKVEKDGYVITGVRFRTEMIKLPTTNYFWTEDRKMPFIYLQIQVGQLLPSGFINESSVYWQSAPNDLKTNSERFWDFHMDQSDLYFDNAVLTGLKLYTKTGKRGKLFGLKIYGRICKNSTLGDEIELQHKETEKFLQLNAYFKQLKPEKLNDSQSYVVTKNLEILFDRNLVEKLSTNLKLRCPYIDASDVTLDTPVPLSGIGLLHYRNDDDYAGCIKPFLKTLHYKNIL